MYDFGHELYLYWKMYADAGQINLYLNYYCKHEMSEGDSPIVGIILCGDENDPLVKYTTTGLSNEVIVSKYLVQLPRKETLEEFIRNEKNPSS